VHWYFYELFTSLVVVGTRLVQLYTLDDFDRCKDKKCIHYWDRTVEYVSLMCASLLNTGIIEATCTI